MDTKLLVNSLLFRGNTETEIASMLNCLGSRLKAFKKGELIFHAGEILEHIGIVISGHVHIEIDDFWGNKSIMNIIEPGQIFAEAYACTPGEPLMVNAAAASECEILFLNIKKILQTCSSSCIHHNRLIQNLLTIMAQKNLQLSRRMLHTAPKTIRERLLAYLSFQALRQNSHRITIPFNRQQLADYLNVDRSALSNELGKMHRDGILEVHKNQFILNTEHL